MTVCVPSPPPGEPTPPQSRCAGLSRGKFPAGGGFVCTGAVLGAGMEGRVISPPLPFIGSLTTARTAAAPAPLSCLPRLPPLSPSAARRNSMPIRFGALRQPDQRRGCGAGGSWVGEPRLCPPCWSGHPPVSAPSAQGRTGKPPPDPGGAFRRATCGRQRGRPHDPCVS